MKPLSTFLNPELIQLLQEKIDAGFFPKITFQIAMQFILTDGTIPKSNLPAASFLKLEDWIRQEEQRKMKYFTATELKNKTGEILDQVLSGHTIRLMKHGRAVAEIKRLDE